MDIGWRATIAFVMAVLACGAHARPDVDYTRYLYGIENGRINERGVFKADVPRLSDLERDLSRLGSYPGFLDYLFAKAPSLRGSYILLHHSASLQLASFAHPRVVLFDGGMFFAVSEDPMNRKLAVEILEVSPDDYSITMAELTFGDSGARLERNPKACVACHGQPARVVWDPYDFWPQAFGSAVGIASTRQEQEGYQALKAGAGGSELLRRLEFFDQIGIGQEQNTAFTQYIGQINLAGWMWRHLKNADLGGWAPALMSVGSGCHSSFFSYDFAKDLNSLLELFPEGERELIRGRLSLIHADVVEARAKFTAFQDRQLLNFFPNADVLFAIDHQRLQHEITDISLVRGLLDLAGVNAANLSTSPVINDYLAGNPGNFLVDFLTVLFEVRPDLFHGLHLFEEDMTLGRKHWVRLSCDELKARSLGQSRSVGTPLWRPHRRIHPERPVINRCAKCHSDPYDDVPYIPFEDTMKLAEWLRHPLFRGKAKILSRVRRRGEGQMPPGKPLSTEEIQSLEAFLSALE